jgi:hypothetical protein
MLFSPLEIRGVRLKNRVVVAPMHQYSAVEGFATDWHLVNAGKYAQGGAGLVIMESTKVARSGCGTVGDTGLWDDKFIASLARCAAFIKTHGAVAGIQLGHSGRKARLTRPWEGGTPLKGSEPEIFDWEGWELVAPSAVPHTDKSPTPRALSHNEVRDLAVKWGEAAARAPSLMPCIQSISPVTASRATAARRAPAVRYILPLTTSGVTCRLFSRRGPRLSGRKRQATSSLLKLEALIWSSAAYRVLARSPP